MARFDVDALIEKAAAALESAEARFAAEDAKTAPKGTKAPVQPTSFTGQPTKTTAQPTTPAEQPTSVTEVPTTTVARSGRKWSDDDYRLRGFKTPAERNAEPRDRLNVSVRRSTSELLKRTAIEMHLSVGEALDMLLAP